MIDLSLSEDQQQIVDSIIGVLQDHSPVSRLRPSEKPMDAHRELADWGWFGVGLPEEQGGLGLGAAEEVMLFFEAGRFLLSPGILATTLAAHLCPEDTRPDLLSGTQRAGLALVGEGATYVLDGDDATLLVVFENNQISLAPADAFDGEPVVGFDEALSTKKGVLGKSRCSKSEPADHAWLLIASMLAGIARASCDLAVEYAKIREQFGQQIGAFQAIKHMCADMGVRAYAAEAQVKLAAAFATDAPQASAFQIRSAALTSLRSARDNASDAIQIHGGIGFTAECDVHFYLKRAHVLGQVLGGIDSCRQGVLNNEIMEVA